jgi:membrane-bound ClpP family serine protease
MIVLGLILLLIGLLVGPAILTTLGIILLVVGLIVNLVRWAAPAAASTDPPLPAPAAVAPRGGGVALSRSG